MSTWWIYLFLFILNDNFIFHEGSSVITLKADMKEKGKEIVMGSSNPGTVTMSHGGVARNVSEALAKGGVSVALVRLI